MNTNQKRTEKNQFSISKDILELEEFHKIQAALLVNKLRPADAPTAFIQLDCIPNLNLNAFNYGNGLKAAEIIRDLTGSYLASDRCWLERKIDSAGQAQFKTDWQLGEEAGLWKRICLEDYREKIDWEKPFCLKNEEGKTKIWHPKWRELCRDLIRRRRISDISESPFSNKVSLISFISRAPVYLQRFYLPLASPINNNPGWRMYYRLVFLAEAGKKLDFIGGLWISRPGYKIYPGSDALVGLVSPLTSDLMALTY